MVVILFLSDESVRVLMRVLTCRAEGNVLPICVLVLRVDNYSLHLRSTCVLVFKRLFFTTLLLCAS